MNTLTALRSKVSNAKGLPAIGFCRRQLQAGFTLIELLIVIAILGILATAVLSAINPVEQINRGRDTGTQSDAEQLLSAAQRFNAAQGYFPWQTGAADTANVATGWTKVDSGANPPDGWTVDGAAYDGTAAVGAAGSNVLDVLGPLAGGTQELQQAFINRVTATTYNTMWVYNSGGQGASTYVCFRPQSGSFLKTTNVRWGDTCANVPADITDTSITATQDVCVAAANRTATLNSYYCLP